MCSLHLRRYSELLVEDESRETRTEGCHTTVNKPIQLIELYIEDSGWILY